MSVITKESFGPCKRERQHAARRRRKKKCPQDAFYRLSLPATFIRVLRQIAPFNIPKRIMEKKIMAAPEEKMGQANFLFNGESIIYGYPGKQGVREIAGILNEKYTYVLPFERKDRGLDVIAWKPFGDGRASQIILLVQCASGHNWKSKLNDLNLNAWCSYIHFACRPIKAFTVPVVIFNDESLKEHSWDGGLILDRTRLYRNIAEMEGTGDDSLRAELVSWCNNRLAGMSK